MSRSINSIFITLALTACSTTPNGNTKTDLIEVEPTPITITVDNNQSTVTPGTESQTSELQSVDGQTLSAATSTSSYGEDHAGPTPEENRVSISDSDISPYIGPTIMDAQDFDIEAELSVLGPMREMAEQGLSLQMAPMPNSGAPSGAVSGRGSSVRRSVQSQGLSQSRGFGVAPVSPPPVISNTEGYTNYGVNDMTSTGQDRFSTFSIDVDTGSYTIARRKLNEGMLPPAASVRVEEFINYFPYEYEAPNGPAPFAVHMEATPNPFQNGHHILRVGIQAQDMDLSERNPVHLTFLVDVSGSMSSADKLGLAQRSLRFLVDQLQEGDTVALATYAGRVSAVLEPTDVSNRGAIHSAIMGLQSGGSTAMNSGIQLAYRMAQSAYVPNSENRVIVLSDGDANVGPSSHSAILNTIREYANNGITLSTIGFGMGNYQDTMMEQLANQGDGNYSYIDTYDEAKRIFGENLAGTLHVVARDVKLQVEFNPTAVSSYRLIGYENRDIADRDFRNDAVDAGEIGAGHTVTALYDLVLTGNAAEDLATVRVRNKAPGPDAPAVEWLTTMPYDEMVSSFAQATPSMRIAFSAATFAELLRGSPYAAEISWEQLIGLTSQAQRPGIAADGELLSLQQRAASLAGPRGATAAK
jgi:Ca-activated chloride channel family protein